MKLWQRIHPTTKATFLTGLVAIPILMTAWNLGQPIVGLVASVAVGLPLVVILVRKMR
jgi:hypothetical protein